MTETYTITDLATEFAITPRTLRFYEDKGLLAPERRGSARIYSRRDRARLKLILRGKRIGFSLAEVQDMIELYDIGDGQVAQAKYLLRRATGRIQKLKKQRQDINDSIRELTGVCDQVEAWLEGRGKAPDFGRDRAERAAAAAD